MPPRLYAVVPLPRVVREDEVAKRPRVRVVVRVRGLLTTVLDYSSRSACKSPSDACCRHPSFSHYSETSYLLTSQLPRNAARRVYIFRGVTLFSGRGRGLEALLLPLLARDLPDHFLQVSLQAFQQIILTIVVPSSHYTLRSWVSFRTTIAISFSYLNIRCISHQQKGMAPPPSPCPSPPPPPPRPDLHTWSMSSRTSLPFVIAAEALHLLHVGVALPRVISTETSFSCASTCYPRAVVVRKTRHVIRAALYEDVI